jgi:ATP-dependent RNA helicase DeaD
MHQAGRSAPEELSEVQDTAAPRERKPRVEIEDPVWVTLTVGHANRAEARWLLPMLCKAGPMKKAAIGAIRVRENETYVQLDSEGASEFLGRIGQGATIEDGIEARLADGPPGPEERRGASAPQGRPDKPHPKTGTRSQRPPKRSANGEGPGSSGPKKPWKPDDTGEAPFKLKRKAKAGGKPKPPGQFKGGPKTGPKGKKPGAGGFRNKTKGS